MATDNSNLTLATNNSMAADNNHIFKRWFDLIQAISGNDGLPASEIAEILGTSVRNAYYTLKLMQEAGLIVTHQHGLYSIDARSPFFQKLLPTVTFSHDQAAFMYRTLAQGKDRDNPIAGALMRRLQRYYHLNDIEDTRFEPRAYRNKSRLQRAIRDKRIVILHDYSSSNSKTVTDRVVEPFLLIGDGTDVRAYEIKSGRNKTFKIARIGEVETLEADWAHEKKHRLVFTDMFMYSSEDKHHVKLRFDLVAYNFMREEYPHSDKVMTPEDKTHWIYETDLASYAAIGRFILGLYDDIEVMEDEGLREYINGKIGKMRNE